MIFIGKVLFYCLELRTKKKGERRSITWGDFSSLFWTILVMFSLSFWTVLAGPIFITADVCLVLSGPACVLGLIDGPMPLLLIFCCRRLLGSVAVDYWALFVLGPQRKVCCLGSWAGVAKNEPLHFDTNMDPKAMGNH